MCHRYTSISLDREEPSRSLALATGIIARYDELTRGVGSTHQEVEHRDSTQGQRLRSRGIRLA
jgi:hypothetical protein